MSSSNRADVLNKAFKVLKKHYTAVKPPADRPVLEHVLYACCLENSSPECVDDIFAKLQENYFDWNEVRVTSVRELAEVMAPLNDPDDAARRLKSALQGIFETHYSFDLDGLRKQNLGKAVKEIEQFKGVTSFGLAYSTQNALAGHSIPVNKGALDALVVLGVISEADAAKGRTPGMERAIPKTKGVEFGSLLHQLGADYLASPFSSRVRTILLEIEPGAKDRLPKRSAKKVAPAAKTARKKATAKEDAPKAVKKKAATKKAATKRLSRKKPR